MIEIETLHHLSFTAPDLDPAVDAWRDLLAFRPTERPERGFPGARLRGYGTEVSRLAIGGCGDTRRMWALDPGANVIDFLRPA